MSLGGLQAKGKPGPLTLTGQLWLAAPELQWASQVAQQKRTRLLVQETQVWFWGRKVHWNRKWQPALVFLPWKFHGQKSLVAYSPRGLKELDTTEHACTHTHTYSKTTRHLTFHRNQMVDVLTGIIMWLELGFVKYRLIFSKYLRPTQIKINFVSYIFV